MPYLTYFITDSRPFISRVLSCQTGLLSFHLSSIFIVTEVVSAYYSPFSYFFSHAWLLVAFRTSSGISVSDFMMFTNSLKSIWPSLFTSMCSINSSRMLLFFYEFPCEFFKSSQKVESVALIFSMGIAPSCLRSRSKNAA